MEPRKMKALYEAAVKHLEGVVSGRDKTTAATKFALGCIEAYKDLYASDVRREEVKRTVFSADPVESPNA